MLADGVLVVDDAGRVWALPFLTALAHSERYCREHRRRHKKLTDWARQLLSQARRWLPDWHLIAVADSSFATIELLAAFVPQMTCVTRLRLDARLFTPAPPHAPSTVGRPRVKGERRPLLRDVLADAATAWQRVTVPGWYSEGTREVELATGTGVWHHPGLPVVALRWVLVRDALGRFDPQALLSTDQALSATEIVGYFVRRWQVEVTFEEARRSSSASSRSSPCSPPASCATGACPCAPPGGGGSVFARRPPRRT